MKNQPTYVELFMPTKSEVDSLSVGDFAPDAFGKLSQVVEISYRGVDVHGKAYVCYYTEFGPNSKMSNSMKENTLMRHAGLRQTSRDIDKIEQEMRQERNKK